MKKFFFIAFLLSVCCVPFKGYAQSQEPGNTLLTIAGKPVYASEFLHMYRKNINQTAVQQREDVETYLRRFIDFKLKVTEAENLGLDTLTAFKREFSSYRKQLAKPYLIDNNTVEQLVKEAYEHMKYEVNASHILIRCGMDASPGDTLDAYNRILQIRKKILEGTPFSQMARAVSDDPSAKDNGGTLGYFTALQLVYPFEKTVYSLTPGELSMPVRTRFGYHLIRVNDKRPNPGTVKVAHIMVAVPRNAGPDKQKEAFDKINDIYRQLKKGVPFDSLARKYSDDYNSARNGGVLPWFGTGKMVQPFEKAAFALKKPGDISGPVKTGYGWHIIRLLEKKPLPPFDEMAEKLRRQVLSSDRGQIAKEKLVTRLMIKYKVVVDSALLEQIAIGGTIENGRFLPGNTVTLSGRSVAGGHGFSMQTSDLIKALERSRPRTDEPAQHYVVRIFDKLLHNRLTDYEESRLPFDNTEYSAILKEYHDGMLLFEIMDRKVWSKATNDTTGLKAFYNDHRSDYMSEKKQVVTIYRFDDPRIAKSLLRDIKKVNRNKLANESLPEKYSLRNAGLTIRTDTLSVSDERFGNVLPWKKGTSGMKHLNGHYYIFQTARIILPEPKPLNDIRGIVTADYQDYLENRWIEELRKKYPVTVNKKVLSAIKNEL